MRMQWFVMTALSAATYICLATRVRCSIRVGLVVLSLSHHSKDAFALIAFLSLAGVAKKRRARKQEARGTHARRTRFYRYVYAYVYVYTYRLRVRVPVSSRSAARKLLAAAARVVVGQKQITSGIFERKYSTP
jgi:hypothetical protein